MVEKRKRGRPPRGEYADKSEVVHFRIRPDTKTLLEKAARASGRTMSQETEWHLRRSLCDLREGPTHALMRLWGTAIDATVNLRDPTAKWWSDPYLFEQARRALNNALDFFRPPPDATAQTVDEVLDRGGQRQAEFSVESTLREIQSVDPQKPFARQSAHERWLNVLRKDLGPLADRPKIWGYGAEETREQRALRESLEPLLLEYLPLARMAGAARTLAEYSDMPAKDRQRLEANAAMTAEQQKRYEELKRQIADKIEAGRKSS